MPVWNVSIVPRYAGSLSSVIAVENCAESAIAAAPQRRARTTIRISRSNGMNPIPAAIDPEMIISPAVVYARPKRSATKPAPKLAIAPAPNTANAIALAGDAAQRERWLPPIAAGDSIVTCGLGGLDPDCGASPALTAVVDGDSWRLEGCERFVPDAGIADWIVLPARVEDFAGGLGIFVIAREDPHATVEPMLSIDPLRTLYTVECAGAVLPRGSLLGGRLDAEPVLRGILDLPNNIAGYETGGDRV